MYNFALIGLAGYIAPRHLKAIKETDNQLIVALDKTDSVGIVDRFFPKADFFTEPERFERYIYKLQHSSALPTIDYMSICSPNYLHDAHIRMALRNNAFAICEKPLVLNPWNIDALQDLEQETGKKIFNILQLRLHPTIQELKKKIDSQNTDKQYDIELTYITGRGNWYKYSWKGDDAKSGGLSTNIGIHLFDILQYIFGAVEENVTFFRQPSFASGFFKLKNASVKWFLSIDERFLPQESRQNGQTTFRSLSIDGQKLDFTLGFEDLHTESYKQILSGNGFGLQEAKAGIEIVQQIRNATLSNRATYPIHPLVEKM
ncbi:MAG: Gfo/Idh/MocA family oxidoreductase [Bacteroidales bacterium]|jgi:UDP-N-acetyl-2-amino-2-deoxyglucuronate dehydrogenase|nr:Gfo/Idh/MocA family oxidoreductase [Bacteroidales bacterium]